jgi:hypothetical protein
MARGRLLFWLYADIARLDKSATEAASAYDSEFREITLTDTDGDGVGEDDRVESATITVKAQVETDREELQRMSPSGDVPDSSVALVCHLFDLENAGLVDSNGIIAIQKGDRLVKIRNKNGTTAMSFDSAHGRTPIYCTHVKRLDGWLGQSSNLVLLLFRERATGRA